MSVALLRVNQPTVAGVREQQQQQQQEEEEDHGMTNADNDRDARFRDILQQSFGKNGLTIIAIFVMVLMISMLLVLAISFSYTSTIRNANNDSAYMSVVLPQQQQQPSAESPIVRLSRAEPIILPNEKSSIP